MCFFCLLNELQPGERSEGGQASEGRPSRAARDEASGRSSRGTRNKASADKRASSARERGKVEADLLRSLRLEALGAVLGLALFNNSPLPIDLPLAMYRHLLGIRPTPETDLADLAQLDPVMARSLLKLGQLSAEELAGIGLDFGQGEGPVTEASVQAYVESVAARVLWKDFEADLALIRKGFRLLFPEGCFATRLLTPAEVDKLLSGSSNFKLTRASCVGYGEGLSVDSVRVKMFWDVVETLDQADHARLVEFITGCPRPPVAPSLGSSAKDSSPPLFWIHPHPGFDRLPTSATCFQRLFLTGYSSPEKLRECLRHALDNSQGFGLV